MEKTDSIGFYVMFFLFFLERKIEKIMYDLYGCNFYEYRLIYSDFDCCRGLW